MLGAMKRPTFMTQSPNPPKMDRLAAFVEVFKLRVAVLAPGERGVPALLLAGPEDGTAGRVIFRPGGFSELPPDARIAASVDFDNDANPLMNAMPAKRNIPTILPRMAKQGGRVRPGEPGYEETAPAEAQGQWKV